MYVQSVTHQHNCMSAIHTPFNNDTGMTISVVLPLHMNLSCIQYTLPTLSNITECSQHQPVIIIIYLYPIKISEWRHFTILWRKLIKFCLQENTWWESKKIWEILSVWWSDDTSRNLLMFFLDTLFHFYRHKKCLAEGSTSPCISLIRNTFLLITCPAKCSHQSGWP